jgi:hypothetical protein
MIHKRHGVDAKRWNGRCDLKAYMVGRAEMIIAEVLAHRAKSRTAPFRLFAMTV